MYIYTYIYIKSFIQYVSIIHITSPMQAPKYNLTVKEKLQNRKNVNYLT